MRCEQEDDCEAVCVHQKKPYRGILYGNFEKAKCTIDPDACADMKEMKKQKTAQAPKKKKIDAIAELKRRKAAKQQVSADKAAQKAAQKEDAAETARKEKSDNAALQSAKQSVHHGATSAYALPRSRKFVQRSMDRRFLPAASVAGSFLANHMPASFNQHEFGNHGLICPGTDEAQTAAADGKVKVVYGSCVTCEDGKMHDTKTINSKTGDLEYLNDVFFLPGGPASEAIKKGYCEMGIGEQQFPCACLDDDKEPDHRWADFWDSETKKPDKQLGMLKQCSMKCREAALNAAREEKSPKQFEQMELDDAVRLGYQLLTPKMDEDFSSMMDKKFWRKVLEPVKSAEKNWIGMLFPDENDPHLSPNHPGAAAVVKEYSSPYGELGDDDAMDDPGGAGKTGAETPEYRNWQCYYLPKKCRQHAQQLAKEHIEERREKVMRQEQDLKEFKDALYQSPPDMYQGAGTVSAADYWAKSSAPVTKDTPTGVVTVAPAKPAATLDDPRIRQWYAQCRKLPELVPIASQNLSDWMSWKVRYGLTPKWEKTFIHQPNNRWLECAGGLSKKALSGGVRALEDSMECRALHEEPIENCPKCPLGGADKREYKCLAKGFNAIPSGEWSPVRSLLRPVAPAERPDDDPNSTATQKNPKLGSSSELLAAREAAALQQKKLTQRIAAGELRCVHIGRPGDVKSRTADRVIYAASQVPLPAAIAAALSPQFRQLQQASPSKFRRKQCLESFL